MCLLLRLEPLGDKHRGRYLRRSAAITSCRESRLEREREWKAHDFELWTMAFNPHQPHLVYTGSDDCGQVQLLGPLRQPSVAKSPHDPNSFLTGSYDESLRAWDMRVSRDQSSRPRSGWAVGSGGSSRALFSRASSWRFVCTTASPWPGSEEGTGPPSVVERYGKHESLAYGADWHRVEPFGDGKKMSSLVATCSFYDKLLRLWIPEIDLAAM